MYKAIRIKNFRGFAYLEIKPLARVNLIAGPNNIGKTAVLEALWMHHSPNVPDTAFRVNRFRGLSSIDPNRLLPELFLNLDSKAQIELSATGDWSRHSRTVKIRLGDRETSQVPLTEADENEGFRGGAPDFRASRQEILFEYTSETGAKNISRGYYVASTVAPGTVEEGFRSERAPIGLKAAMGIFLAARQPLGQREEIQRLSALSEKKQDHKIVKILQHIDPRIRSLSILTRAGNPTIYVDVGESQLLPAALLGNGALRLMTIALAIVDAEGGIVLIDEIENGLYYQVIEKVWEDIGEMAEISNVQLFATTHSDECLRAAHKAFSKKRQYGFRLHRLEMVRNAHRAVTFDQEMLATAIQTGLEVR